MKPYKVLALLKKVSLLKAGDRRVKVNGEPLKVDYRIVADDLFRDGLQSLEEALSELEAVKAELEMSKYTGQSAVNELHKYKQETDEIVRGLKAELEKVKLDLHVEKEAQKVDTDLLKKAQSERDELRAFVKEVKNLSGRKTFPTEKELQETYRKAKLLLNTPE